MRCNWLRERKEVNMFDSPPDPRMAVDALKAVIDTQNPSIIADAIGAVLFLMSDEEIHGVMKPLAEIWIEILRGEPLAPQDDDKIREVLGELESHSRFTP